MGLLALAAMAMAAWLIQSRHRAAPPVVPDGSTLTASLPQDVYIWQRAWTPDVVRAVHVERGNFRRLVILAAEISAKDNTVVTVKPDWAELAQAAGEIGLAIRVGPLPAAHAATAFNDDSVLIQLICRSALAAIANARAAAVKVAELQIDFDCAEAKLAGYQKWARALKVAVTPVPVVITVLPSWLKHPDFIALARAADGLILQVHSLHRPQSPDDSLRLCDVAEARRAVADVLPAGVPFRLALPTYSYLAGFSREGSLLGLAGEGAQPSWPDESLVKTLRSDPAEIAGLVHDLMQHHPELLTGIIWYRLPVAGDTLNWHMPTLQAVMAGRIPQAKLAALAVRAASGATDVYLQNTGDAEASAQCRVTVEWRNADLVAADGINGFAHLDSGAKRVTFLAAGSVLEQWIAPGDRRQIGWLRLSADTEVTTHVESSGQN